MFLMAGRLSWPVQFSALSTCTWKSPMVAVLPTAMLAHSVPFSTTMYSHIAWAWVLPPLRALRPPPPQARARAPKPTNNHFLYMCIPYLSVPAV